MIERPAASEHAPYYARYIALVEGDLMAELEDQPARIRRLAAGCPASRERYRYAEDKWIVREVLGHITDGERVFGHRIFRISRGDATPLPPFDENLFVAQSRYADQSLPELAREFSVVREANLTVLRRLEPEQLVQMGTASGNPVSVRALAYIMAGHARHHLDVLRERYGVDGAM